MAKRNLLVTAAVLAAFAGNVAAQEDEAKEDKVGPELGFTSLPGEFTANVSVKTDYVFRGVSQTNNSSSVFQDSQALQGGFDWSHQTGFYAGTWMSNVDTVFFAGAGASDPQIEQDFYAGFSRNVGDTDFGYDVGMIHYNYPGASQFDTNEWYASLSWKWISYTANFSNRLACVGSNEEGFYHSLDISYPLPRNFSVSAHAGFSHGDAFDDVSGPGSDISAYGDGAIGLSKSWSGLDWGATFKTSFADGQTLFGERIADERVVFSVSKSF